MNMNQDDTAVAFIDSQNEVLSDKGLAWGAVGDKITGLIRNFLRRNVRG
jgi:hypothetical protein